jgi:hypothetical protein
MSDANEPNYAVLLERIERLEDHNGILRTLHTYGQALDVGDEDAFVDCFTEDATFDARGRSENYTTFHLAGREAFQDFVRGHTRPPVRYHLHLVAEPIISLEERNATSRSYMMVVMEHEGEPVLRVFGRYRDTLRKCDDGRWRFVSREAEIDSMREGLPKLVGGMLETGAH